MSTRSTIAIKRIDGTVTGIYCHWDGYIENNGVILQLAYNTAEKVEELLALGDLSHLGYYLQGEKNACCAYHRDCGEVFRQSNSQQEFNYIFDEADACWYVEDEKFNRGTEGLNFLCLPYVISYPRSLLLDRIAECDFEYWKDDEFAKAGEVYEACKEKAFEARKDIIERNRKEYNEIYYAYCN